MDKSEKKKVDRSKIDEKAIIAMVGKSSRFNSSYENTEGPVPHKALLSQAEESKAITQEDVKNYIEAYLNNFLSSQRKPLHIDAEVYECISDMVWAVRRKDFTVSGYISRVLAEHLKENSGLIEKITGRSYKLFES